MRPSLGHESMQKTEDFDKDSFYRSQSKSIIRHRTISVQRKKVFFVVSLNILCSSSLFSNHQTNPSRDPCKVRDPLTNTVPLHGHLLFVSLCQSVSAFLPSCSLGFQRGSLVVLFQINPRSTADWNCPIWNSIFLSNSVTLSRPLSRRERDFLPSGSPQIGFRATCRFESFFVVASTSLTTAFFACLPEIVRGNSLGRGTRDEVRQRFVDLFDRASPGREETNVLWRGSLFAAVSLAATTASNSSTWILTTFWTHWQTLRRSNEFDSSCILLDSFVRYKLNSWNLTLS